MISAPLSEGRMNNVSKAESRRTVVFVLYVLRNVDTEYGKL